MKANLIFVALLVLISVAGLVWWKTRKPQEKVDAPAADTSSLPTVVVEEPEEPDEPLQIVIGQDATHPIVTMRACLYPEKYELALPLNIHDSSISRLSALSQAVPSMLIAGDAAGKRLVEVVVNGDLARAADGNGMRGFVVGAKGVTEHARFFDVANLQKMINVAAVWQIASVIVAQKHLADISEKLDEIKSAVIGLSQYIEDERKADVEGTYKYLKDACLAIQGGEFPPSIRNELESCDRELRQLQIFLRNQYVRKLDKLVEHKEFMGTETLTADILKKMQELDELFRDIVACTSTRILAWHVLSLYPGEPKLKEVRRASIEEELDLIQQLNPKFEQTLENEINRVHSKFNFNSTLDERRRALRQEREGQYSRQAQLASASATKLYKSAQALIAHDKPSTIFLEFGLGGALIGARRVREAEPVSLVEPPPSAPWQHLGIV